MYMLCVSIYIQYIIYSLYTVTESIILYDIAYARRIYVTKIDVVCAVVLIFAVEKVEYDVQYVYIL